MLRCVGWEGLGSRTAGGIAGTGGEAVVGARHHAERGRQRARRRVRGSQHHAQQPLLGHTTCHRLGVGVLRQLRFQVRDLGSRWMGEEDWGKY